MRTPGYARLLVSALLVDVSSALLVDARPAAQASRLALARHQPVLMQDGSDPGRRQALFGGLAPRSIRVGDNVVANNDWNSSSPAYGIVRAQVYELRRVYYQGLVDGCVQRVDVERLDAPPPPGCAGYKKYVALYSRRYHSGTAPVVLQPSEVEVVRVRDEVSGSAWLALPGLFWTWLAFTFYKYGEERGGAFRGLKKGSR